MIEKIVTQHHFSKRAFGFVDASGSPFATGDIPRLVTIADVNGDGQLDLVSANVNSNDLSVLLGVGDGTFGAVTNFMVGDPISVAIADVNGDGKLDLVAGNQIGNNLSVLLGTGTGNFGAATNFATGAVPVSVAIADVNRDGKLDLVSANFNSNDLSVLLGTGTGVFSAATNFTVGTNPRSLAIADVNGDGKLDLVSANSASNDLSVLLGTGTGSFGAATNFTVGANPRSLAIADVNGDGKLDLVSANNISNDLSVLLGDGIGTFGAATNFAVGGSPRSVAIADVNGDGKLDLVATNINNDTLSVLLGTGMGTFGVATSFAVGASPWSVAIADINDDGQRDLVSANSNSNNLSVLLNQLQPTCNTFIEASGSPFAVGTSPISVEVADINRDGKLDFLSANQISNDVSVRLGNGLGGFNGTTNLGTGGTQPVSVAIADINRDGNLDFLASNQVSNEVSVRLGDGLGGFSGTTNLIVGTQPRSIVVADINGDGKLDFLTGNVVSNDVSVRLGDGLGGFSGTTNLIVGTQPRSIVVADINGDGKLDFLTANYVSNDVSLCLGDGMGGFSGATSIMVGTNPRSVVVADVNKDGKLDFLVTNIASNDVSIRLGDGLGGFSGSANVVVGSQPRTIAVADVNGDGKLDFLTANNGSNDVSIRLGDGIGGFNGNTNVPVGTTPWSVTIVDVNGDGKLDFMTSNAGSNDVSVLLNQLCSSPSSSLTPSNSLTVSSSLTPSSSLSNQSLCKPFVESSGSPFVAGDTPAIVATADVNGDSKLDLVSANYNSDNLSVLLGNGDGTFAAAINYGVGSQPHGLAIADVNGDGKLDLVSANFVSNNLSVLLGTGTGSFNAATNFPIGIRPLSVAIADINSDGNLDLVSANFNTDNLSVLLGDGTGNFAAAVNFPVGTGPFSLAIADVNGDGKLDLASANHDSNNLSVLLGNGAGNFSPAISYVVGTNPRSVVIADINGDNKQDLVSANRNSKDISVLMGNGDGTFNAATNFNLGTNPVSVSVADVNNDGNLDLVSVNVFSNNLSLLLGTGAGNFSSITNYAIGSAPRFVAISDINNDGRLDLISANAGSNNLSVLLNQLCPSPSSSLTPSTSISSTASNSFTASVSLSSNISKSTSLTASNSESSTPAKTKDKTIAPTLKPKGNQAANLRFDSNLSQNNIAQSIFSSQRCEDLEGFAVSGVGDFNNDGIKDYVVGAPGGEPKGRNKAGYVTIVYGNKDVVKGQIERKDVKEIQGSLGFRVLGAEAGDQAGYAVSGAGDVNGDGYADVLIAAPYATRHKRKEAGLVTVLWGTKNGYKQEFDLKSLTPEQGFTLIGATAADHAGLSVNGAGDVNGDGLADILIGAPDASIGGEAYLIYGSKETFPFELDLNEIKSKHGVTLVGAKADGRFGYAVSGVRDVNKDGYDDLLIGAPEANSAYLVYGNNTLPSTLMMRTLTQDSGCHLLGESKGDRFGATVSRGGDVNSDGVPDILIGAPNASPDGRTEAGNAYVIYGRNDLSEKLTMEQLSEKEGVILRGDEPCSHTGQSISVMTSQGKSDILIGAPDASPEGKLNAGQGYIIRGEDSNFNTQCHPQPGEALPKVIELGHLQAEEGYAIEGTQPGNHAGFAVAGPGDIDDNSQADFIITAVADCTKTKPSECQKRQHEPQRSDASRLSPGVDIVPNLMLGLVLAKIVTKAYEGLSSQFNQWFNGADDSKLITKAEPLSANSESQDLIHSALHSRWQALTQQAQALLQQAKLDKWLRYHLEDLLDEMTQDKHNLNHNLLDEWGEELESIQLEAQAEPVLSESTYRPKPFFNTKLSGLNQQAALIEHSHTAVSVETIAIAPQFCQSLSH